MRFPKRWTRLAGLFDPGAVRGLGCTQPANSPAAEQREESKLKSGCMQDQFDSPEAAVKALQAAVEARDRAALREIYRPGDL